MIFALPTASNSANTKGEKKGQAKPKLTDEHSVYPIHRLYFDFVLIFAVDSYPP
jgi:hypothetical protein